MSSPLKKGLIIGCGILAAAFTVFVGPWILIGILFAIEDYQKDRAAHSVVPTSLETAVGYRYATPEMVAGFIDRGGDVNGRTTTANGGVAFPFIAVAVSQNNVAVVRLLIERGARVDDANLWQVLRMGQDEMALLLLEKGASLGPSTSADPAIGPELLQAAAFGHANGALDVLLARHADLHVRNAGGEGLLELAIYTESMDPGPRSNSAETTKRLLAAGVDPRAADELGSTPLHWAAHRGKVEELEMLLAAGAAVDAPAKDGSTPLSVAVEQCQPGAVEALLARGAARHAKTPQGRALADGACAFGYPELNKKNEAKILALLSGSGAR